MAVSSMCNLHVQRRWETLPPQPRQALKQTLSVFNALPESIRQGENIDIEQVAAACTSLVTALNDNHIQVILDAVRDHDDYTFVHCLRVSTFLSIFGHVTGLSRNDQVLMANGGLLHDVGKMCIAYDLLNKPGRLDSAEFEVIKTHVQSTVELLQRIPHIRKPIITIASQHHERLDGSGYPGGIGGTHLDELARTAAIVDVFCALTDRRTYKSAMDPEAALTLMLESMASQLDMRLLAIFRQAMLDAAVFSGSAQTGIRPPDGEENQ
jgi:HD-GYP domain-containing protein (c-di-GMP phosphodiesterase class II)